MKTTKDAVTFLGCSRMTLNRYVNDGKVKTKKQKNRIYYDETDLAKVKLEMEGNIEKHRPDLVGRQSEIPKSIEKDIRPYLAISELNEVGLQSLNEATANLIELGLLKDIDKHILYLYAINYQSYHKYFNLLVDAETNTDDLQLIDSYHRKMMSHEKMMNIYSDKLGMNPLARQKLVIEEKSDIDEMESLIS